MAKDVSEKLDALFKTEGLAMEQLFRGRTRNEWKDDLVDCIVEHNSYLGLVATTRDNVAKRVMCERLNDAEERLDELVDHLIGNKVFTDAHIDKIKTIMAPSLSKEDVAQARLAAAEAGLAQTMRLNDAENGEIRGR